MRGLIKEVLSLSGWIIALFIANAYGEQVAEWMPEAVPGHAMRLMAGFVILFIGVRLLIALLSIAIDAVLKATGISIVDRGFGAMFGLARGLVIVLAAVLACGMTAIPQQPFWKNAVFSSAAENAARVAKPYLPGTLANHVKF